MKALLQGAWLGHPLHGFLVHLPVGLWASALLFDLLSLLGWGGPAVARTSYYAIITGLVVALAAVVTGLADFVDVKPDKPAWRLGLAHLLLNGLIWVMFALNAFWRWSAPAAQAAVPAGLAALTLIAVGLLFVSGYLGGRMVYAHGISVARMSKNRWRQAAQAGGARVPEDS